MKDITIMVGACLASVVMMSAFAAWLAVLPTLGLLWLFGAI